MVVFAIGEVFRGCISSFEGETVESPSATRANEPSSRVPTRRAKRLDRERGRTPLSPDGAPRAPLGPTVRTIDPPIPKPIIERVGNPVVTALLRSPLHGLLSDSLLSITFTGRKSGREYTTPVGYEQRDGTLFVTSQTDRVWWKNLRGGATVTVRLRGVEYRGHADVVEDDDAVADYVRGFVDRHGIDAVNRLALAVDGDELPARPRLAAALSDVVVVRIDLGPDGDGGE